MATKKDEKSIAEAIAGINKEFGDGTVLPPGTEFKVDFIPTSSVPLNHVFGCGGIPKSRVLEIYGMQSAGKSALAYYLAASVQKAGGTVAWIDVEGTHDDLFADLFGVDTDKLVVSKPGFGEEALSVVDRLASAGVDFIVLDSVASLLPKGELEAEFGDQHMALQARMMSTAMRKITATLGKSKTTVCFLNQLRENVGAMGYGPKKVAPGGNALPFFASIRLELSKIKTHKDKDDKICGHATRIKNIKNKVGPPGRETEVDFYEGIGYDWDRNLLSVAEELGVVERKGLTLFFGETKLGPTSAKGVRLSDVLREPLEKAVMDKLEESASKKKTAEAENGTIKE